MARRRFFRTGHDQLGFRRSLHFFNAFIAFSLAFYHFFADIFHMLANTIATANQQHTTFRSDGFLLSGILHLPAVNPRAIIIGCHGLMADKNSPKQIDLANHCTSVGLAYFRFDHRGCGDSEGDFQTDTTLEGRTTDLVSAARKVSDLLGTPSLPLGLFGSSLGGTVCLTAAGQLTPFSIVTLAAPVQSKTIQLPDDSPQSLKNEVNQNGLRFDIASLLSAIHHVLIIHGSDDRTVNIQNAHTIFKLAQAPKRTLIIEKGDHRITNKQHQKQYVQEAVQWYLDCLA